MGELLALRDGLGSYLSIMGDNHPDIVMATADLSRSARIQEFIKKFPDRYYNVGIAEQDLMSFAAGLAHESFIPYVFTFAPFASMRACEQVRTDICYPNLPVRILGNGAGYSYGICGATHCALEDCAIMTSFGNMTVLDPSDPFMAAKILEATYNWDGPIYIRMSNVSMNSIYAEDVEFKIGKALTPREGNDGAFITAGIVTHYAIEAADRIKEETGKEIRVVDMHTIKPLDKEAIVSAAKTGNIVCAQDHNIIGGLGYAAAAVILEAGIHCRYKILGCPDKFVPIATPQYLYKLNEYDTDGLYKHMKAMIKF